MRQRLQLQRKRPLWPTNRHVWLLALGLALAPGALSFSAYAETFPLDSVDFKAGPEQTQIVLHTGSIVPVNKVSSSADKLVLEIDQVDASETVKTNFSGAPNITHIIMQPINEHKIRLIVRGEHLAPPNIAFYNPSSNENNARTETAPSLFQMKQSTEAVKPAMASSDAMSSTKANKPADKATASDPSGSNDPEMMPFLGEEAIVPSNTESRVALLPQPTSKRPVPITNLESSPLKSSAPPSSQASWMQELQSGHYNNLLLGGLLSLLALGFGGWMVLRILKLRNGDTDLDELLPEKTESKKSSFKEMADAYRNKHQNQTATEFDGDLMSPQPSNKKAHAEDVIGLHRLNQMDILPDENLQPAPTSPARKPQPSASKPSSLPADVQKQTANIEQLLAMMQSLTTEKQAETAKQAKPAAAPRQAIQQYAQNQTIKPQDKKPTEKTIKKVAFPQVNAPEKAKDNAFPTAAMNKDMQRAQALQKELIQQAQQQIASLHKPNPVNRALAAQKNQPPASMKKAPATNPSKTKPQPNRAMGEQPSAGKDKNGPLVGNPQVLDFLRNVADLMEKDGKPQIANSIQKNIRPM